MKSTVFTGASEIQGDQLLSQRESFFEVSKQSAVLEWAETLDCIEAHIQELTDALRYFVELGGSHRPRDFADVKRTLIKACTLINSSVPRLPELRVLAAEFRELASEIASRSNLHERSIDPSPPQKEQSERRPEDRILSEGGLLTGNASAENPSTSSVKTGPPWAEQDEQNGADVVLPEIKMRLGNSSTDHPALSTAPRQNESKPDEQERVELVLSEIKALLEIPSKQSKPGTTDPLSNEVEVVLGKETTSIFSEIESFLVTKR